MIELLRPWVFLLLPLPFLAWRFLPPLSAQAVLLVPDGVRSLLFSLTSGGRGVTSEHWFLNCFRIVGWFSVLLALAGPYTRGAVLETPTGRDLVVALDLSSSMEPVFAEPGICRADRGLDPADRERAETRLAAPPGSCGHGCRCRSRLFGPTNHSGAGRKLGAPPRNPIRGNYSPVSVHTDSPRADIPPTGCTDPRNSGSHPLPLPDRRIRCRCIVGHGIKLGGALDLDDAHTGVSDTDRWPRAHDPHWSCSLWLIGSN